MNVCRSCWVFCVVLSTLAGGFLSLRPLVAQEAKATTESRTWKDKDGNVLAEGALLFNNEAVVLLKLKDGLQKFVPLDKLSKDDQAFVSEFVNPLPAVRVKPASQVTVPETTPPPIPAVDPLAPFDLDATLKYWNDTVEPLQLAFIHSFQLERKPDLVEFSANGEILYIVFYKEAKHLLYGTKDGKLIETIEYGTAPLTAAAITPDGKHLVATLGDKGTGVYEVATKK